MASRSDPDVDRMMNEVLAGFFLPAVLVFVGLLVALRLGLGDALAAVSPAFAEPIVPRSGRGAVEAGLPRFAFAVVATAVLLAPYLVLYARVLRPRLRERGWV